MRDVWRDGKHDPINKAAEHITNVDSQRLKYRHDSSSSLYVDLVLPKEREVNKHIAPNPDNVYSLIS